MFRFDLFIGAVLIGAWFARRNGRRAMKRIEQINAEKASAEAKKESPSNDAEGLS